MNNQLVFAYDGDEPIYAAHGATGAALLIGACGATTGLFMTLHKRPTRPMANGYLTADGYDLPGVLGEMYFTGSGLSLHSAFWHNDFGHPKSHGCVNLNPAAAKWLFLWTNLVVKRDEQFAHRQRGR